MDEKASTVQSTERFNTTGVSVLDIPATSHRVALDANSRAIQPLHTPNTMLSNNNGFINCQRVAPSESLTLVSRIRPTPRVNIRFAMFEHATSSTTRMIANKVSSVGRN